VQRAFFLVPLLVLATTAAAQQAQREIALQHLRTGQQALQQERYEEAERAFKSALDFDSRLELAHYGLGQTYMATRRYAEAVQAYTRCRATFHANESDRLASNVDAERRLDDQIRSLRDLRRGLESGRQRTPNLATALSQIDSEIRQLEGLRRRTPGSAPVTPPYISMALGSAFFRTGAFAEAEQEWRNSLAVDPTLGEVHSNLAVVLMLTQRYDEAGREIELAEKAGFKVSPKLKEDLQSRRK
jgi:tetratricopeptide (TPR) repeat protein